MNAGCWKKGCLWTGGIVILVFLLLAGSIFLWTSLFKTANARESRACGIKGEQAAGTIVDEEFMRILQQYSATHDKIGMQAAIILPDGRWWNGAAGYADIGKKCPLTLEHGLFIGSITKLYTATLIMQQVEKGTLSLDDPIRKWVDLPYADQVNVRMLLNHTSGIPDYINGSFLQRQLIFMNRIWQPEYLLGSIRGKPLLFTPGERHQYSTTNYLLLGMILEKVTGKSYNELVQSEIVRPLDLGLVLYEPVLPAEVPTANGYDISMLVALGRQDLTSARRSLTSGNFSGGGLLSRAIDTARFTHALFQGDLVGESELQEMMQLIDTTQSRGVDALPEQFGYGLGMRAWDLDGEKLYGHTGHLFGYSSVTMHNPKKGYTITVLSNLSTIDQALIVRQFQAALLNGD